MSSDEGKLYVGGLSFDTTEQSLEDVFSKYGQISEVVVIKDKETLVSRGFGFVTFENPDEAKDAIEAMNGKTAEATMQGAWGSTRCREVLESNREPCDFQTFALPPEPLLFATVNCAADQSNSLALRLVFGQRWTSGSEL